MTVQRAICEVKVIDRKKDGGRIIISTRSVDRDRDRVLPEGAKIENYMKNPVVMWGHDYRNPWATVGRTNFLEVSPEGITADFTLRPAANEADPQNIVLLLWDQEYVRTASIGFNPEAAEPNDVGGLDFNVWELLEWSLVPIPSNQDALRLAAKSFPKALAEYQKRGRVLSAKNEKDLRDSRDLIDGVLSQLDEQEASEEDDDKSTRRYSTRSKAEGGETGSDLAWVRRMEAISDLGTQQLFAVFRSYTHDIPPNATTLECDTNGDLVDVPHPDAGKTVTRKEVVFVPPLAYTDDDWGEDATYSISTPDKPDEELVKGFGDEWQVTHLSEVLASIPAVKSARRRRIYTTGVKVFTHRGLERAKAIIRRKLSQPPAAEIDDTAGEALLARLDSIKSLVTRN